MDFPGGCTVKNLPANTEDIGSILGSGRSTEKEMATHRRGNTLTYSCMENPMDRGAQWVTVHGVAKESDTT